MKKTRTLACAFMISLMGICSFEMAHAQQHQPTKKVKTQADRQYDKAGKFKRVLLGEHYRKDWAATVELEVLDFEKVGGGLTVVKLGGGMQTLALRLKGADGKDYVLRSVRKDPTKALPPEMVGSIADDVLQDQISSSNPFAALVAASLARSAGILHNTPRVFYVQDSKHLGQYSKLFANTVCLLEERPTGNQEQNPAMLYSSNVINTHKLFEKLISDPRYHVDEHAFLKARLLDMLIGDWDRHEDQWSWAEFKSGNEYLYKPVPRDRDQAFAKLDGVIPQFAQQPWAIRKTKDFDYRIHDVAGLNMSGNPLDRNFTTRLTREDWLNISKELKNQLTDEAIETAVKQLPPEIYLISGDEMTAKLKSRKNELTRHAIEYYRFLSKEVDITGTGRTERFEVRRLNDDSTEVTMHAVDDKNFLLYKRIFNHAETKEIRLYGFEGNDIFKITGSARKGIAVRVIGGQGRDSIIDRSAVGSVIVHKTKIYDDRNNAFETGTETRKYISSDTLKNNYNRKAFTYDWLGPKQSPGYNPDDGVYIGGGITFRKQQFGKHPYGYMHSAWANYAMQTGAYNFWYKAEFIEFIGKYNLHLDARVNAPNFVKNFYGIGNETQILQSSRKYYRVRLDQEATSICLGRSYKKSHYAASGVRVESIKVQQNENRFITDVNAKLDSAVFDRKYFGSIFANYQYNTLDNALFPKKGFRLLAGLDYTRNVRDNTGFLKLTYESSVFFSMGKWTAAIRSGAATNLNNDFEFYQANALGGTENLRGVRRDRFAGKSSVYNNTEIRYSLGGYRGYIFRGEYGLLSFVDQGRVWTPGEKSKKWHYGYGGGIWFFAYNRIPVMATYAMSKEDKIVNIKAGFLF